ncbi:MAG: hypothetical protein HC915_14395 [Anaerolineae bacterium]|nr:hypothetical protein [Anaerolineae bacterium]
MVTDVENLVCQDGAGNASDEATLLRDIDGDTLTDEVVCVTDAEYEIREAAQMRSEKWIRSIVGPFEFRNSNNLLDPTPDNCPAISYDTATAAGAVNFTRFPCVAQAPPAARLSICCASRTRVW